jgi:flagellar L-ring protein precursor FlgH
MKLSQIISLFMIGVLLTGCESTVERLKRVGKAPDLAKLEVPIDEEKLSIAEKDAQNRERMKRTNSLWQPGSTSFFRDNRAWKVGDILKVVVQITDKATLANSTSQTRNNGESSDVNQAFGKNRNFAAALGMSKGPRPGDVAGAGAGAAAAVATKFLDVASKRNIQGTGNIARQETIQTNVAVLVRQVLPNGNLIIEGHQEVRVNHELREVRVAGIIRPRDISSENSINSDQIAEARISYGGRGVVSDMQRPRYGSEVVDIITPF